MTNLSHEMLIMKTTGYMSNYWWKIHLFKWHFAPCLVIKEQI